MVVDGDGATNSEQAAAPEDIGGVPMEEDEALGTTAAPPEAAPPEHGEAGQPTCMESGDAENGPEQPTAPTAPTAPAGPAVDNEDPTPMEAEEDCSICADPLGTNGGIIQKLSCGHRLCRICIATHLFMARQKSEAPKCPLCNQDVTPDDTIACGPGQPWCRLW